jgi:hypothetical protein
MCEYVVVDMQRVIAVVSQVVHFLSDLLASGTALSGDKDAPPLPLGYASTVLTRFLRAFRRSCQQVATHVVQARTVATLRPVGLVVSLGARVHLHHPRYIDIIRSVQLTVHSPIVCLLTNALGVNRSSAARTLFEPQRQQGPEAVRRHASTTAQRHSRQGEPLTHTTHTAHTAHDIYNLSFTQLVVHF